MAVAIKAKGYTQIKIYNGGLKDWIKSGNSIIRTEPLPVYDVPMTTADELYQKVVLANQNECKLPEGEPVFTLLDLRTEQVLGDGSLSPKIKTNCPVITGFLDNLMEPDFRQLIPRKRPVYILTETGNRDKYAARYLSGYGYTNASGLLFGMRGWIKAEYPTIFKMTE